MDAAADVLFISGHESVDDDELATYPGATELDICELAEALALELAVTVARAVDVTDAVCVVVSDGALPGLLGDAVPACEPPPLAESDDAGADAATAPPMFVVTEVVTVEYRVVRELPAALPAALPVSRSGALREAGVPVTVVVTVTVEAAAEHRSAIAEVVTVVGATAGADAELEEAEDALAVAAEAEGAL